MATSVLDGSTASLHIQGILVMTCEAAHYDSEDYKSKHSSDLERILKSLQLEMALLTKLLII